jgi:hypothetical protein
MHFCLNSIQVYNTLENVHYSANIQHPLNGHQSQVSETLEMITTPQLSDTLHIFTTPEVSDILPPR